MIPFALIWLYLVSIVFQSCGDAWSKSAGTTAPPKLECITAEKCLSADESLEIRVRYKIAIDAYFDGYYFVTIDQMKRIHSLVPEYRDSIQVMDYAIEAEKILLEKSRNPASKEEMAPLTAEELSDLPMPMLEALELPEN